MKYADSFVGDRGFFRDTKFRSQNAEPFRVFRHHAVQLTFIVLAGNHPMVQVLLRAAGKLAAQRKVGPGLASIEPARHIILPAIIGDAGPAPGVAVIWVEPRRLAVIGQMADCHQSFLPAPGQEFPRLNGPAAFKVRVGIKQIVKLPQFLLPCEENPKTLHGGIGPGQSLLLDAAHIGLRFVRNLRRIGKNQVGFGASRQKIFLKILIKFRPEHRVFSGAEIKDSDFHWAVLQSLSFMSSLPA